MSSSRKRHRSEVDDTALVDTARPPRDAKGPFQSPTADCILRSSDNVDYRVHKLILSLASPIFESMFSLPTPTPTDKSDGDSSTRDGLPVIPVPETSAILNTILCLCYPTHHKLTRDLSSLMTTYDAAEKYSMDDILPRLQEQLIEIADYNTSSAYAFGYRHQLKSVVIAAAMATLPKPLSQLPSSPELERITGTQLQKLNDFHNECQTSASAMASRYKGWSWIPDISYLPVGSMEKTCVCQTEVMLYGSNLALISYDESSVWCAKWFEEYMVRAQSALRHRPVGSTVTDDDLLVPALRQAAQCGKCEAGMGEMLQFSRVFSEEIDIAVREIAERVFADIGPSTG
ncbi:uncharacterized protein STEHIDRAFT_166783 [Stereum hirsutum FP-91666 SS1]|uniref:uncharacterized protein n=1 Tax=Stereum hirsutum (strain FP-91666) TaxID=721885 RepID=UPI000440F25A|nr:uncharacterized protein STEHIDRAFT_166783 [Stereum hirsutum FP-91666 SS1]EIM88787.1 hypothetical protein STEHIDRAFT_166783 [Stereum hirsutum FP-91666 SS1]